MPFVYFVCFVVSLLFTIAPARAELVVYPDYPEQIERDYAYAVRCNGAKIMVWVGNA